MSESFNNTNPSAYSTPTAQPVGTSASQIAANNQPPAESKTVPIGEGGNSAVNNVPQVRFDSETQQISSTYAQKYLAKLNNQPTFTYDENANVNYSLTNSLNDPQKLKNSFLEDFRTQAANRKAYTAAQQLFASQDNQNNTYTYGRLFFKGNWINTRTPIDENGNPTGLPEMLPEKSPEKLLA